MIFVTIQPMNRFFYRQIFVCFGCSIYGETIADSYRNIRIGGGIKPVPWKRILISPWTVTLFNRVVSAIFVCNAKANASIDVFRCSMFPHVEVVIQRDSYNTGARNIFVIFRRGEGDAADAIDISMKLTLTRIVLIYGI